MIRVMDMADGISPEQLNPNSEAYIFKNGKESSGENSTGLGLGYTDTRLQSMGVEMHVYSKDQSRPDDGYTTVDVYPGETRMVQYVDNPGSPYENYSTTFELRLPVQKMN